MAERSSLVRLQENYDIEIDWRGFELHPETPEGGMPITRLFPASRVGPMHERLKNFAAEFGITGMIPSQHIPNTRRALAVAEWAREKGKLTPFRHRAMDAYWLEGKNVEDVKVLQEVATAAGLPAEEVPAAMNDERYLARIDDTRAEANEMGVTGIPTFIFGNLAVVGCQPYEVLERVALRAGAKPRK
ncbi:MAG: DsbA family protein [Myxococcota bacterium]